MPVEDARNFVIWVSESMLPKVEEDGALSKPRLLRILSHHDQDTECMSLQFEVEDNAALHKWYVRQGASLAEEMKTLFSGRIVGFGTIMEEVH